jgi:hypothetical protein
LKKKRKEIGSYERGKSVWSTSMRGVGGCCKEAASKVRKRDHKWAIGA